MCWAAVEILEQLLQTIFLALGFAFDLSGAPEILQQGAMQSFIWKGRWMLVFTLLFSVFRTQPVRPYAVAFFLAKYLWCISKLNHGFVVG
jgi:hypothetical protein